MRKLMKIGIVVLLVLVILIVSVFAIFALDFASYGATGSETLNPSGNSVGRALVVYDPGLSGAAKQDATRIANDLLTKGILLISRECEAALTGIKSWL